VRALLGLWGFKAVYTVQPDEVGVELRFGKPKAELSEPGLHFHWWPIETVETAKISEQLVNIGDSARSTGSSGLMLSGDQNIVNVQFSVAYEVSDPRRSEEHTSELQSRENLVCRLLLEKKKRVSRRAHLRALS